MRAMPYSVVAVVLSVVASTPGALAQEKFVESKANERVTIVGDSDVLPLTASMIHEIVQSKEVAGEAVSEITGEPVHLTESVGGGFGTPAWTAKGSEKLYTAATIATASTPETNKGGQLFLTIYTSVHGATDVGEAEKLSRLLIKRLDKVLAEMSRRAFERKLAQHKSAAEEAGRAADFAAKKLQETRAKVREESSGLSITVLQELVSDLKKTQQALEVELAGMKGRAEALQVEVAKTAERVKKAPAGDEVRRHLTRVIEIRSQQLERLRASNQRGGAVSSSDIAKAEEQVALAQVELAQAKQSISRPAADQLEKLSSDLSQIAINIAESEAKLKYVAERLEEQLENLKREAVAKPLREQLDKETANVALLQAQANHAAMQVKQLQSSYRPARVEVFDLKTSDDKPANTEKAEKR